MIEKVNPSHPDKLADRIAGALVDLTYAIDTNNKPKTAVEVLLGHGSCSIIIESNVEIPKELIYNTVSRIVGTEMHIDVISVPQDAHLAENQENEVKCGDNGIFKGVPLSRKDIEISKIAREIYQKYPTDGKYILTDDKFICCQSNAKNDDLRQFIQTDNTVELVINPLGEWTGGSDVDAGATNRKLGSDMAESVTGGGLHGKDLSKADVSVNIYCFEKAQETKQIVTAFCAIGDTKVRVNIGDKSKLIDYKDIVEFAKNYIERVGGFEKFAEWGLY